MDTQMHHTPKEGRDTRPIPRPRSMRADRYERTVGAFKEMLVSTDRDVVQARDEANRALVGLRVNYRDNGPDAVHQDASIQNLSLRFYNEDYIGDRLFPVATVTNKSNVYWSYDHRASLSVPSTRVGPRGEIAEVSQKVSKDNAYNCHGYAVQEFVDMDEIGNADMPLDPLYDATILVNEGLAIDRERRIRDVATNPVSFGSNTTAIQPNQAWNSSSGGSPVKLIQFARSRIFSGPAPTKVIGYCSENVFRTLSRHPSIRDLFKYVRDGFATEQQIAQYFNLDELLVGRAWEDTANEGQVESVKRLWPDVFGIVRVAQAPSPRTYAFGMTFRWGVQKSEQRFDASRGRSGGYYAKVSVAEDHKVMASRAGYLITNCLDPSVIDA